MNTVVVKRPDQPELNDPYFEALDGSEYQVVKEDQAKETYPICICVCHCADVAKAISSAINNGTLHILP